MFYASLVESEDKFEFLFLTFVFFFTKNVLNNFTFLHYLPSYLLHINQSIK